MDFSGDWIVTEADLIINDLRPPGARGSGLTDLRRPGSFACSPAEADTLLDWCEEAAMYDICITKIGVVPMTRRSDIIKILVIAALLGALFYYLAHYGLSWPQR